MRTSTIMSLPSCPVTPGEGMGVDAMDTVAVPSLATAVPTRMERRAACFRFHPIPDQHILRLKVPFLTQPNNQEIPFVSLPVFHGGEYRCLGFAVGRGMLSSNRNVCCVHRTSNPSMDGGGVPSVPSMKYETLVYLSDISAFPADVLTFLKEEIAAKTQGGIDVLIIDMLHKKPKHFSHMGLHEALDVIFDLCPVRAYGVGMFCDIDYTRENTYLAERLREHNASIDNDNTTTTTTTTTTTHNNDTETDHNNPGKIANDANCGCSKRRRRKIDVLELSYDGQEISLSL